MGVFLRNIEKLFLIFPARRPVPLFKGFSVRVKPKKSNNNIKRKRALKPKGPLGEGSKEPLLWGITKVSYEGNADGIGLLRYRGAEGFCNRTVERSRRILLWKKGFSGEGIG